MAGASCCKNYCDSKELHKSDKPVVLLMYNENPDCIDSSLQVICFVESGVSHLLLYDTPMILYRVQVSGVCWPVESSSTKVIEPAFNTLSSLDRFQVLLQN